MTDRGTAARDEMSVLLLGNLQSGKTMLFRRLCGDRFTETAIPQTSRTLGKGQASRIGPGYFVLRPVTVYDTPGTATLFPQGEEEVVCLNAVLELDPDVLLVVADAKNLRRALALVAHAAEFDRPMVLALNMEDEAWRHGIDTDVGLLSTILGIDVVPTVATTGKGVGRLLDRLSSARRPRRILEPPARLGRAIDAIAALLEGIDDERRGLAGLLLARDERAVRHVADRLGKDAIAKIDAAVDAAVAESPIPFHVALTEAMHATAVKIARQVQIRRDVRTGFLDALGRWSHHPVAGPFIALLVVAAVYLWIGEIGATRVVDFVNGRLFEGVLVPACADLVSHLPSPLVRDAIMDPDFGLVPSGLFLAFGLVLPVLFFFYIAFNILLESGYLARLSVLLDRVFRLIGLNGKGILPLTMGFSCVTMALITTRMLDSRKERLIASFLLVLGTPCAPMLGVLFVVFGPMPATAPIAFFGLLAAQKILLGLLANRLVPGLASDFILEIPPMRVPRMRSVLSRTARQTYHFMKEAVPLFLLASLVMFTIARLGGLEALERAARPVVHGWFGLPDDAVQVFIKNLIRREAGAAELQARAGGFDNLQLVVTMLVMTLLTPCMNAVMVLVKERGLRDGLAVLALVFAYAVAAGAAFNFSCRALGVTFT